MSDFAIVVGNETADRNPGVTVEEWQHGFPDRTSDILEIDVDSIRACRRHRAGKIRGSVIDDGVEPKLIAHVSAFGGASGDADGASARELSKLSHQRSDRTTRRCDNYSLPWPGLPDDLHPRIGRETGHSKHAQGRRGWVVAGLDLLYPLGRDRCVRSPADLGARSTAAARYRDAEMR